MSGSHRRRLWKLLGAFALGACSVGCGAAAPLFAFPFVDGTTKVCFAAPAQVKRVDEGPFARAVIASAPLGGARFELARFDLPQSLTGDQRRRLMDRVERGLLSRPDRKHAEVGTIVADGVVTRVLSVELTRGRFGKWLLSFPSRHQMLQTSVVGPAELRPDAEAFFATLGATSCDAM